MPKYDAAAFDFMIRTLRDFGMLPLKPLFDIGIDSGRVLDAACGSGVIALEWFRQSRADSLIGVDSSSEMLNLAENNLGDYSDQYGIPSGKATFRLADVCGLPFDDESFDAVFSFNALHEVADPVKMLDEIWRVTKRGGLFCVRDLHAGGDWTTLDWASKLPQIESFRPLVRQCLSGAFSAEQFGKIVEGSAMKAAEKLIRPMLLCLQGRRS